MESSAPGREPKETTLTLAVDGRGTHVTEVRLQDVVFMINASGSMRQNDPSELRLAAAKRYMDRLTVPDRAAAVVLTVTDDGGSATASLVLAVGL